MDRLRIQWVEDRNQQRWPLLLAPALYVNESALAVPPHGCADLGLLLETLHKSGSYLHRGYQMTYPNVGFYPSSVEHAMNRISWLESPMHRDRAYNFDRIEYANCIDEAINEGRDLINKLNIDVSNIAPTVTTANAELLFRFDYTQVHNERERIRRRAAEERGRARKKAKQSRRSAH